MPRNGCVVWLPATCFWDLSCSAVILDETQVKFPYGPTWTCMYVELSSPAQVHGGAPVAGEDHGCEASL